MQSARSILLKLTPAVPRYLLFALAGLLWTFAGVLLCVRGAFWLLDLQVPAALAVELVSGVLAAVIYSRWFFKLVEKNIKRICNLPERACLFAFTGWHGYVMIAIMMTAGIMLRNSSITRLYLSPPYTVMGGILLTGSVGFYRRFWSVVRQGTDC